MPPYTAMNEHHPPNPVKQQHHNIIEDRICLSHLNIDQYLSAQPVSLGLCINWISEVLVPGKIQIRPEMGLGWDVTLTKTMRKALGTILTCEGLSSMQS